MKCFSGTNSPERPPNVHCGGRCNFSAAACNSCAFSRGDTLFNDGAGGITASCELKRAALLQIKMELRKSRPAAAISKTLS